MRAERRNITVTSEKVSEALDRSENVSKFIEKCILYYLEDQEIEYARAEDLESLKEDFKIMNRNYLEVRDILNELVKSFM